MTKFESEIKYINASQEAVFAKLSDFSNLESVKDKLPEDKVKNLTFDSDSISVDLPSVGTVKLKIVELEPCKCIKMATEVSPLPINVWIQLLPVTENQCKMKLTLGMEINPIMKSMIQKPLQQALEKLATLLTMIWQ